MPPYEYKPLKQCISHKTNYLLILLNPQNEKQNTEGDRYKANTIQVPTRNPLE